MGAVGAWAPTDFWELLKGTPWAPTDVFGSKTIGHPQIEIPDYATDYIISDFRQVFLQNEETDFLKFTMNRTQTDGEKKTVKRLCVDNVRWSEGENSIKATGSKISERFLSAAHTLSFLST